jgi:hypothetical protein
MLGPRGPTTSSGDQNLDGEPSLDAGGLQAPTIHDDSTLQSNAIVSSKFTFTFPGAPRRGLCTYVHGAKPNPHELVMLRREGLLSAEFFLADIRRERPEEDGFRPARQLLLLRLRKTRRMQITV